MKRISVGKKKKCLFSVVLLLTVWTGLAGCGTGNPPGKTNGEEENSENQGEISRQPDSIPDIAQIPPQETELQKEPPNVILQTSSGETVSGTVATRGSYSWNYDRGDGTMESAVACGSSPDQWEEIATIKMEETEGIIELCFSGGTVEYTLNYWIQDATCGVPDPVPMDGDSILLQDDTAKGIYELHVTYENGDAYYGFKVE